MPFQNASRLVECVCTGCDFYDEMSGRWVHGDLHTVGGAFVFNAVMRDYQANWQYEPMRESAMTISNPKYFERRGVIVFPKAGSTMSETMLHHVRPEFRVG